MVELAVVIGIVLALVPIAQEKLWEMKRDRVREKIKASYMQAAARGEVALPATNPEALCCWSVCFWSLPNALEVRTPSSNRFFYIARRNTNSPSAYSFRFVSATDPNGNTLTNIPGI